MKLEATRWISGALALALACGDETIVTTDAASAGEATALTDDGATEGEASDGSTTEDAADTDGATSAASITAGTFGDPTSDGSTTGDPTAGDPTGTTVDLPIDPPPAHVLLKSDPTERGDLKLADGDRRLRITKEGKPTAVYWVRFKDLAPGMEIRALADLIVSRCEATDFAQSGSGCFNTPAYGYAPTITSKLYLARESGTPGVPRTDGVLLGEAQSEACTDLKHHCLLAHPVANRTIKPGDEGEFIVLVAEARHPDAKACNPPNDCHVVDLEGSGAGELSVFRKTDAAIPSTEKTTSDERAQQLRVSTSDSNRDKYRKVIYSLKLGDPAELRDAQFEVRGRLEVDNKLAYEPLVSSRLILAKSATATDGLVLTDYNGENCKNTCVFHRPGAIGPLTKKDLDAGYTHVNLVAFAVRTTDYASEQDHVAVTGGGELRFRRYDGEYAEP